MSDRHNREAIVDAVRSFGHGYDHADCPRVLKEGMAAGGTEVTVSTMGSITLNPYCTEPFVCPHGTTYWLEPTTEQIMDWNRRGVK